MASNENLLTALQSYVNPDFISRISGLIGQSPDKVKSGLAAAIPALLMGIVNKGANMDGAQTLMNMIRQGGFESGTPGDAVKEIHGGNAENLIRKGLDIVNSVFGKSLDPVTDKIATSANLPTSGVTRLLGIVAPIVMSVLGNKVKQGGLNASSLMNLLSKQRSSLMRLVPSNMFPTDVTSAINDRIKKTGHQVEHILGDEHGTGIRRSPDQRKSSWLSAGLLTLLLLFGAYWLLKGVRDRAVTPTEPAETVQAQTRSADEMPAPMSEFDEFLAKGSLADIPKRFNFEDLHFEFATTRLLETSGTELDRIAAALNNHPATIIRLEGYTDSVGNDASNLALSHARANKVREELIARGVAPNRIEAVGLGSSNPVATNSTDEGRAQNRRIELVILEK